MEEKNAKDSKSLRNITSVIKASGTRLSSRCKVYCQQFCKMKNFTFACAFFSGSGFLTKVFAHL